MVKMQKIIHPEMVLGATGGGARKWVILVSLQRPSGVVLHCDGAQYGALCAPSPEKQQKQKNKIGSLYLRCTWHCTMAVPSPALTGLPQLAARTFPLPLTPTPLSLSFPAATATASITAAVTRHQLHHSILQTL